MSSVTTIKSFKLVYFLDHTLGLINFDLNILNGDVTIKLGNAIINKTINQLLINIPSAFKYSSGEPEFK